MAPGLRADIHACLGEQRGETGNARQESQLPEVLHSWQAAVDTRGGHGSGTTLKHGLVPSASSGFQFPLWWGAEKSHLLPREFSYLKNAGLPWRRR